jgi:hypothetical protein
VWQHHQRVQQQARLPEAPAALELEWTLPQATALRPRCEPPAKRFWLLEEFQPELQPVEEAWATN